jgi:ATP-dependent DNA helicase RecG
MKFIDVINQGEGKRLELKEKLPSHISIAKTAVAFSNTSGGKIVIGINDDLKIVGVDEDKIFEIQEKVSSIIYDLCYPNILPEIYTVNIHGKLVVVIEIFRGSLLPYYLKNKGKRDGTYIRIGSTNRLADESMILELERQRRGRSFDEEENFDYEISDLKLDIIYEQFKKIGKKANYEKLKNLKLIKTVNNKDIPTNALLIALGHFDNVAIKCARFKGKSMEIFIDKKEFAGNLFDIMENTMIFLQNHLNLRAEIKGLRRKEEYEIPIEVLREALLNAIIHRDYTRNSDIKVAIYDDIVEIISPGALPNGITIEEISNGRSELRNKVLAYLFKELEYIEAWGSGIAKIREACKLRKINFRFEEKGNFVSTEFVRPVGLKKDKVTPEQPSPQAGTKLAPGWHQAGTKLAPSKQYPASTQQAPSKYPASSQQAPSKLPASTLLGDRLKKILIFCKEPKTRGKIQTILDIKDREHFRAEILKPLLEDGLLQMTIPDKPNSPKQKYVITEKGKKLLEENGNERK